MRNSGFILPHPQLLRVFFFSFRFLVRRMIIHWTRPIPSILLFPSATIARSSFQAINGRVNPLRGDERTFADGINWRKKTRHFVTKFCPLKLFLNHLYERYILWNYKLVKNNFSRQQIEPLRETQKCVIIPMTTLAIRKCARTITWTIKTRV